MRGSLTKSTNMMNTDSVQALTILLLQVCMEDFEEALKEVKPAFGAVTETLEAYRLNGIVEYGDNFRHLLSLCKQLVEQAGPQLLHKLLADIKCGTMHVHQEICGDISRS